MQLQIYVLYNCKGRKPFNAEWHNKYKVMKEVTGKDLIGQIKDFPIEVVQKMVDCQVKQGNKADVTVFQKNRKRDKETGGFDWGNTIEGVSFWLNIVWFEDFSQFFKK